MTVRAGLTVAAAAVRILQALARYDAEYTVEVAGRQAGGGQSRQWWTSLILSGQHMD